MKKVTLNIADRHYEMIARIAQVENITIETWFLIHTEGDLWAAADQLQDYNIGFDLDDIDEVIQKVIEAIP